MTAAIEAAEAHGHIGSIVEAIAPAVEQARRQDGDLLNNAITSNVARMVEHIKTAKPILSRAVNEGKLEVMGAYYTLATGKVVL